MSRLLVTLVRHGQSVSNRAKQFGGQNDVLLSRIGRMQARLAGEALASMRVTRVISSDLSRAADTARAIAQRTRVKLELFPELRERDVGVLTGKTFDEARDHHPEHFQALMSGDPHAKIGGAESYADVAERVDRLMDKVLYESRGHVVVVGHMVVLRHLLRVACGVHDRNLRDSVTFAIENTALHRMAFHRDTGHWHIFSINETAHLKSLQAGDKLT